MITNEMLERTSARQFNNSYNQFYKQPGPDPLGDVIFRAICILAIATMLFINFYNQ